VPYILSTFFSNFLLYVFVSTYCAGKYTGKKISVGEAHLNNETEIQSESSVIQNAIELRSHTPKQGAHCPEVGPASALFAPSHSASVTVRFELFKL
jgi:hypothetical protein